MGVAVAVEHLSLAPTMGSAANAGPKVPSPRRPLVPTFAVRQVHFGDTADVRQLHRRSPSRRGQVVDVQRIRGQVGGHRLTVVRRMNRR